MFATHRLPAIIMVAIIIWRWLLSTWLRLLLICLLRPHAMATAININIDINTRRPFSHHCARPTAGSGILVLQLRICAKHYVAAGINVCVSRCRASRPTLAGPCSCVNFGGTYQRLNCLSPPLLSTSRGILRLNGSNVQPKLCSMQLAI